MENSLFSLWKEIVKEDNIEIAVDNSTCACNNEGLKKLVQWNTRKEVLNKRNEQYIK